ncbi:hypothetical protein [Glaciihabitans sp. dw_435]|uniref:hypothetical protein n=1 Tax=Glaciihabitans sp. dw_435 TaxID=2720081 RepID=UPI001BD29176|nr:hypothetical protein [Glaciihabitans sp. dw_435]
MQDDLLRLGGLVLVALALLALGIAVFRGGIFTKLYWTRYEGGPAMLLYAAIGFLVALVGAFIHVLFSPSDYPWSEAVSTAFIFVGMIGAVLSVVVVGIFAWPRALLPRWRRDQLDRRDGKPVRPAPAPPRDESADEAREEAEWRAQKAQDEELRMARARRKLADEERDGAK